MGRKGFEILDHTADVRLRVWGKDLRDILQKAAEGMINIMMDIETRREEKEDEVRIEGANPEELLLKWLREILFKIESKGMVFSKFRIKEDNFSYMSCDKYWFYGLLYGEKYNSARHDICTEIKAVTRHGLYVEKRGDNWESEILFDI